MKFGLSNDTLRLIREFFTQYPDIEQVKIYGSRAKGDFEKGSDIDLAFYAVTDKNLTGQLLTEINELAVPYLFDVTDYNKISHLPLKEHIDRVGKIIYLRHTRKQNKNK